MKFAILFFVCLFFLILTASLLLYLTANNKRRRRLERALEASQERWRLALEASQEGVWDWDIEKGEVYYSPHWEEMFGFQPGEAPKTQETFTALVHPEDLDEVIEDIEQCLRTRTPSYRKEFRMLHRDGTLMWTLRNASIVYNKDGKPIRMVGTTLDITERKKAEAVEFLRNAEILKHQQALLQMSSLSLNTDFDEKLKTITRQAAETLSCERVSIWKIDENQTFITTDYIYKLSTDEYLPGMTLFEKDYPEYFSYLKQNAHIVAIDAHTHPATAEFSNDYLAPLGISSMLDIPLQEGAQIVGVICHEHVGVLRNWTESEQGFARSVSNIISLALESEKRRKAEEKLIKSQINFEEAQAIAHVGSWDFDLATGTLVWSKEMFRLFEMENHPPETLYETFRSKIHAEDLAKLDVLIDRTIEKGESYLIEERITCNDGSIRYLSCIGEPVKDDTGKIIGLRGTSQNVTPHKQAALAKSEFLSVMSHEIRTPINGVIGIANLLMEENLTGAQKEYVKTLNYSAQHLSMIVSDILDFSKIESGNLNFEKTDFNLEELCQNVFKLYENRATEKNIEYCFTPGAALKWNLQGDVLRLNQVLNNLISNAVKFTESGRVDFGYIVKEETLKSASLLFYVKDTGIGIHELEQEKIFETFYQGHDGISRKYGGTGLGLAISKKLVELMGGKIYVESNAGVGSVFRVELTFEKSSLGTDLIVEREDSVVELEETLPGMNILIAEDHHINAMVLINLLAKWKIKSKLASNGQEALDLIAQDTFDLVLMDIWMPVMDGQQALKCIRNSGNKTWQNIPVIAFTADASVESIRGFLENGFDDCITKPFNPRNLFNLLKQYYTPPTETALKEGIKESLNRYSTVSTT
ncbi:MAG: PAS domain-containing protein [Saprospiraceae bacterium]|nr:PAS domain-containing protein [Saprospiraceae bacterium]